MFVSIPQNTYTCKAYSIIKILVYSLLVAYSHLLYAVWFDEVSSPEVVRYKIQILNDAFKNLTQGVTPLVDGITSEKVWHDWEDPTPLTEQQYVKIAKFYQFNKEKTLFTKEFSKSINRDNPVNSFDYLAHIFSNAEKKSKYIQEFENKIIVGDLSIEGQPTNFDIVSEIAKEVEKSKDGNKLKYAIRELRKNIELLQFNDALHYALAQSSIDCVKNNIIKDSTETINNYSLVDHISFYANEDYKFFENRKILLAVIDLLKQNAQNNSGILKDLRQINDIEDLLVTNKYTSELQTILNKFINDESVNKKDLKQYLPILNEYFRNKQVNEKNCIASRMLPFRDVMCANSAYFLCSMLDNFVTSRATKQTLYPKKNASEVLTWYKGSKLKSSFTKNIGSNNFKYLVTSQADADVLITGIENNFNRSYTVGMLYGYINSNMTQRLATKELNNKLNLNSNFISIYGRLLLKDYSFKFYINYNINHNKNLRIDTKNHDYRFSNECHSMSMYGEASLKILSYYKLFIEPALTVHSYIHLEHSYEEYSNNIIHKLIPLSIVAKHYQNLDLGAKLTFYSRSKGDDDEIITKLWVGVLQDITRNNPDFLIGVNDSNVLFNDYSYAKRKYEIGLEISWIKNKFSANFDIWSKYYNKGYIRCIGLELNYKL
jgi:hypothetical protein